MVRRDLPFMLSCELDVERCQRYFHPFEGSDNLFNYCFLALQTTPQVSYYIFPHSIGTMLFSVINETGCTTSKKPFYKNYFNKNGLSMYVNIHVIYG